MHLGELRFTKKTVTSKTIYLQRLAKNLFNIASALFFHFWNRSISILSGWKKVLPLKHFTNNFPLSTYNLGRNILELYNVLVQIRLTTSKTKHDISYSKLGIRVASPVAKQLKT